MRYFKKLILSLVVALSITTLAPMSVPIAPFTNGIVLQAADKNSKTVYVTPTGKKYHAKKCGNGSYSKASLSNAKSRGLTACQKCY